METQARPAAGARARLVESMPVTEVRLHLAGIPTALLASGDGPPLILLHGPGEFAEKWLRVIPELSTRHRVIAPDLPGHGTSGTPDAAIDAPRMLDWLDELIEQTCTAPPVLVGHVLGGAIGLRHAIARPGRLAALVLVDALGLAPFRPRAAFALTMMAFLTRPTESSYARFMRQCSYDLDRLQDEMGDLWRPFVEYTLDLARAPNAKVAGRLLRDVGLPHLSPDELARIEVPVALIWGRHDRAIKLHVAEHASARFGWPLHVIENCADDPPRDEPQQFLQALETALQSRSRNAERAEIP